MNWTKPHCYEQRFGFEVTMYVYLKSSSLETVEQPIQQVKLPIVRRDLNHIKRLSQGCILALAMFFHGGVVLADNSQGASWLNHGADISNSRSQKDEGIISVKSAPSLKLAWEFKEFKDKNGVLHKVGDITQTPTIKDNRLYFTDWPTYDNFAVVEEGKIYCLDRFTHKLLWFRTIRDIIGTNKPGIFSRNSILISDGLVIAGTRPDYNQMILNPYPGAYLFALDAKTGETRWVTPAPVDPLAGDNLPPPTGIDPRIGLPYPVVPKGSEMTFTSSPVAYKNRIYVGLAGLTEVLSFHPNMQFYSRGSVLALDINTGKILWQTYMISDELRLAYDDLSQPRDQQRYSGNSVWSSPTIDPKRQQIYVTTGNNFSVPHSDLVAFMGGLLSFPVSGNLPDSIVTLDLNTGSILRSYTPLGNMMDSWHAFCLIGVDSAECATGPDADFGSSAMLFTAKNGKEVLGAGCKSGQFVVLDPGTGGLINTVTLGPAGALGGIHWGTAAAEGLAFAAYSNSTINRINIGTAPASNGRFVAIEPVTGSIVWNVDNPVPDTYTAGVISNYGASPDSAGIGGYNAPPTVANGVVFFAAVDFQGHMFAYDAKTGAPLWSTQTGAGSYGGGSVVDGYLYWGNGYKVLGGPAGNGLKAFTPAINSNSQ